MNWKDCPERQGGQESGYRKKRVGGFQDAWVLVLPLLCDLERLISLSVSPFPCL